MRRKWIAIILAILLMGSFRLSSAYAESTKEFKFTEDLIDTIYHLQLSEEVGPRTIEETKDIKIIAMHGMELFMNQNRIYGNAKGIISKYINDENELIQKAAVGIVNGINLLEKSNNDRIELLRKMSNDDTKDTAYLAAEAKTLSQEGMEKIGAFLYSTINIIIEKRLDNNSPLVFKLSMLQRKQLLGTIYSEFGHYLNLAAVNKEAKAIYFSKEGNFYIGFIKLLSEYLNSNTAEDLSDKGLSGTVYIGPAK